MFSKEAIPERCESSCDNLKAMESFLDRGVRQFNGFNTWYFVRRFRPDGNETRYSFWNMRYLIGGKWTSWFPKHAVLECILNIQCLCFSTVRRLTNESRADNVNVSSWNVSINTWNQIARERQKSWLKLKQTLQEGEHSQNVLKGGMTIRCLYVSAQRGIAFSFLVPVIRPVQFEFFRPSSSC